MAEEQESRQVGDDVDDFQRGQSMGHAYRKWRKKKNGEDEDEDKEDDKSDEEKEKSEDSTEGSKEPKDDSDKSSDDQPEGDQEGSTDGQGEQGQPESEPEGESVDQDNPQTNGKTTDQAPSDRIGENPEAPSPTEPGAPTPEVPGAPVSQVGGEASKQVGGQAAEKGVEKLGEKGAEKVGGGVGEVVGEGVGEAVGEGIGEAAVEGGILAAGAEAAPGTAGASLLTAAAVDVGIEGAKVWWKNKWVITFIIICIIAIPFALGGSIYSYIGKMFFMGSMTKEEKAAFDGLSGMIDTGSLTLEDKADLEAMKKGVGNVQAFAMMTGLSGKHPGIAVDYLDSSSTSTKKNQPFEFDVTKVDKIKCTDSTTRKAYKEFDISLKQDTDWNAYTTSPANIICAPDYYPMIETPIQGAYWSDYGMKEFPLNQASTFAPQVVNYKQAQVLDDMIEVSITAQEELKLKKLVNPDKVTVTESFKSTIPATLSAKLQEAYGDPTLSSIRTFAATDEVTGIHISYLG